MGSEIIHADCLDAMRAMADKGIQFDSVVTDPPYHFASIVKRFGADNAAPAKSNGPTGVYKRASAGFMGLKWDGGDIAFNPETWSLAKNILKPGGHLLAFAATKNYHRLACAIEDAGFEVRDMLSWAYATGMPKSHNLKGEHDGWGSALKPAMEPVCVARKPLEGTIAQNMAKHGVGTINIDGCRIGENGKGRWPANVIHDGSDEVLALFPESKGQQGDVRGTEPSHTGDENTVCYGEFKRVPFAKRTDSGSAARFFYCAKASKKDRRGSKHPTIKPVSLMRYLIRLVTPPGGRVLDPFGGSGTTAEAAMWEGMDYTLVEKDDGYILDIQKRVLEVESEILAEALK